MQLIFTNLVTIIWKVAEIKNKIMVLGKCSINIATYIGIYIKYTYKRTKFNCPIINLFTAYFMHTLVCVMATNGF